MLALSGIKVLDLTFVAPGAYCTMLLGDLGADVLKVEAPPAAGVTTTGSATSPAGEKGARRAALYAPNRNKRSIALDLKSAQGHSIFMRLARESDVLVEGFRPGVMKRLGLDYAAVSGENPRMVYCSLSGYGQGGPYSGLPGHDVNYIAAAGALGLFGSPRLLPAIPLNVVGDFAGGSLFAAVGILAALVARQQTGRGQYVDVSITDGVLSLLTWEVAQYLLSGKAPVRGATMLGGAYPYYGVYEAADGKCIAIGCMERRFWENLCRALGRQDLVQYCHSPEHLSESPRGRKWAQVRRELEAVFKTRTRDEWWDLLSKADVPVSRVACLEEALQDPQLLHRKMVVEVEHPRAGKARQVGIAVKFSETPGSIRRPAPLLGEHTDEVLRSLGYGAREIGRLREEGTIA